MARKGLIERDNGDRRRNVLRLTSAGQDEPTRLRQRLEAIEPTLTAGLSRTEGDEIRGLLHRMLEHTAAPSTRSN